MIEKIFVEAVYFFYMIVFVAAAIAAVLFPVAALILVKHFLGEKVFTGILVSVLFLAGVYCGRKCG